MGTLITLVVFVLLSMSLFSRHIPSPHEFRRLWTAIMRPSLSLPVLPTEITDYIIDFLHDDDAALAACALACTNFVRASRTHLFASVQVRTQNYKTFLDILASPHCTIASSVVFLRLVEVQDNGLVMAVIPNLAALPSLRSLCLSCMGWGNVCVPDKAKLLSAVRELTGITELIFRGGLCYWPTRVIEFICAFPSLRKLHIDNIHWPSDHQVSCPRIHPSDSLSILHLENCYFDPVVRWFGSLEPTPSLHTLRMYPISLAELPAVGELVRVLGESLQHLQFALVRGARVSEGILQSHINLRHNTNLRSIYLDYDHMYERERRFGDVESLGGHVPVLLDQITSPHVTEIHLRCEPTVILKLKDDVWSEMSFILAKPHFSSLQKITFISNETVYSETVISLVRTRLAEWDHRGVLRFKC